MLDTSHVTRSLTVQDVIISHVRAKPLMYSRCFQRLSEGKHRGAAVDRVLGEYFNKLSDSE